MQPEQIDPRAISKLIHGIITSQSIVLQLLADQGVVSVSESRGKFDRTIRRLREHGLDKMTLLPLTVIAEQLRLSEEAEKEEMDEEEMAAASPDMSNFLTLIEGGLSGDDGSDGDAP